MNRPDGSGHEDGRASRKGRVTVWHSREGSLPIYQLAFLMADYLIQRQGLDAVVGYFASFTKSRDGHANFRHALGESLADFETDVLAHLRVTVGLAGPDATLDAASLVLSGP